MGQDDGPCFRADGGLQLFNIHIVRLRVNICKNGYQAVLNDGGDGGWKPAATVIISSPDLSCRSPSFGDVRTETANRFAEEPELVSKQWRIPRKFAKFSSKIDAYLPVVSQKFSDASIKLINSFSLYTLPEQGTGVFSISLAAVRAVKFLYSEKVPRIALLQNIFHSYLHRGINLRMCKNIKAFLSDGFEDVIGNLQWRHSSLQDLAHILR